MRAKRERKEKKNVEVAVVERFDLTRDWHAFCGKEIQGGDPPHLLADPSLIRLSLYPWQLNLPGFSPLQQELFIHFFFLLLLLQIHQNPPVSFCFAPLLILETLCSSSHIISCRMALARQFHWFVLTNTQKRHPYSPTSALWVKLRLVSQSTTAR